MNNRPYDIKGPGSPFWDGPPYKQKIDRIAHLVTAPDSKGRQYFWGSGGMRRLKTPEDYLELNRILQR